MVLNIWLLLRNILFIYSQNKFTLLQFYNDDHNQGDKHNHKQSVKKC